MGTGLINFFHIHAKRVTSIFILGLSLLLFSANIFAAPKKIARTLIEINKKGAVLPAKSFSYTPKRITLPLEKTIELNGTWSDSIRFIYNRGQGKVHFQTELLNMVDPRSIRTLKGYKNPRTTRISYITYEIRSMAVVKMIEQQLDKGFQIRVIADPATYTLIEMPSAEVKQNWTASQLSYFQNTYDLDGDGIVSDGGADSDLARYNHGKELSNRIWAKLQSLKKEFPEQLELISPPFELVPAEDKFLYPRLTHIKLTEVAFLAKNGNWEPQIAMFSSANLTDSCMDRRISQSKINKERYLTTDSFAYAKGSQGHIQFGAIISGKQVIEPLKGPIEEWIELYTNKNHFDAAKTKEKQFARVSFAETKQPEASTIQAFYTEGTKVTGREPVDPLWALTDYLPDSEVEIEEYYDTQFVFTHKTMARFIRHHLHQDSLKKLGVVVDSRFATQPYSALPDLFFAPIVHDSPLVQPHKAIQDLKPIPDSANWKHSSYVFEGEMGVFGGPGDKLHAKSKFIIYRNKRTGIRHSLITFGSLNHSSNGGKLNADGTFIFDTTDESVAAIIHDFIDGVFQEERLKPYTEAFVERRLLETINPQQQKIFEDKFIKRFVKFLNHPSSKAEYKKILAQLVEAGAVNQNGENLLTILKWIAKVAPHEFAFDWAEFSLAIYLANPDFNVNPGFLEDLKNRWLKSKKNNRSSIASFYKMIDRLHKKNRGQSLVGLSPNILRILEQSKPACQRLFLPTFEIPNPTHGSKSSAGDSST